MGTTKTSEKSTMTQPVKVLYTAKAHTTGGREGGASRTSDGRLDVKLSVPGAPGNGTNPEQLFAVGWSACFTSAIKVVGAKTKVKLKRRFRHSAPARNATIASLKVVDTRM